MKEKMKNRKEWIKNITIIFLIIMLVLTFFSNTIMNYSLPEVATQFVSAGPITAKIRGTGVIEATDPYNVSVKESRKIKSVSVKKGDLVQKDDVLFVLEDMESAELLEAEKALDALVLAFETALLTGEISSEVYQNIQNGKDVSVATYQSQITAAKNEIKAAEENVSILQAQVDALTKEKSILEKTSGESSKELAALNAAKANLANAEATKASAQESYNAYKSVIDTYGKTLAEAIAEKSVHEAEKIKQQAELNAAIKRKADAEALPDDDPEKEKKLTAALADIAKFTTAVEVEKQKITNLDNVMNAYSKITDAQNHVNNCNNNIKARQNEVINAQKAVDDKVNSGTLSALEINIIEATAQLNNMQADLVKKQEVEKALLANIKAEITLQSQTNEIKAQRELVEKLRSASVGAEILAPITGTVISIDITAGQSTTPDTTLAVIQAEGKGYSLSFSVTNDQAKKVSPGDIAEISNSWYYENINVVLSAIKTDTDNPSTHKKLFFDITGDVASGQSLNVSVGQKSANYDLIVPNSAIREDNNGKFILIVESKSSPLGNRYMANRVDVEVLASDDTQTAISAALYGHEYVVTTSTKPIVAGKQVRLAD